MLLFVLTIEQANRSQSLLGFDNQAASPTCQAVWLRDTPQHYSINLTWARDTITGVSLIAFTPVAPGTSSRAKVRCDRSTGGVHMTHIGCVGCTGTRVCSNVYTQWEIHNRVLESYDHCSDSSTVGLLAPIFDAILDLIAFRYSDFDRLLVCYSPPPTVPGTVENTFLAFWGFILISTRLLKQISNILFCHYSYSKYIRK